MHIPGAASALDSLPVWTYGDKPYQWTCPISGPWVAAAVVVVSDTWVTLGGGRFEIGIPELLLFTRCSFDNENDESLGNISSSRGVSPRYTKDLKAE